MNVQVAVTRAGETAAVGTAADLLVTHLAQVVSMAGKRGPLRGRALSDVRVIEDGYVLCRDGRIVEVGQMRDLRGAGNAKLVEIDGSGMCALPGLVDCHTHACFAGDRVHEFDLRSQGASYEALQSAGGGILSTVAATRTAARDGTLGAALAAHRQWLLSTGTTTFEAKSGYGLDHDVELLMLDEIRAAGGVPTWLGAHVLPAEFDDADAYIDFLLAEVLEEAAGRAEAADVAIDEGAFTVQQGRRYLEACRTAGLALRVHCDQFAETGAVELAIELGARSVDHLEVTGDASVRRLAESDVAAVLLPIAALFLDRPPPPARALVDAGAIVALASDFNPGSAFCSSLPIAAAIACTQLHLSPAEALGALTVNAAHVLGRGDSVGRLEPGYCADLVLLEAPDWRYLAYHLGGDHVACVIKGGLVVRPPNVRA
jgi:imidazolonepropionase